MALPTRSKIIQGVQLAFAVLLMSQSSTAGAQLSAEWSYKLWNSDCPKGAEGRETSRVACSGRPDENLRVQVMKKNSGETAQAAYLAALADRREVQLDCAQRQISSLKENPKALDSFVDDYESKLTLLGLEKRRMAELKRRPSLDESSLEQYEKSKLRASALLASLPFSELAPFKKVIISVVQQYETYDPSRLEGWLPRRTKKQIRDALSSSLETVMSNRAVMQKGVATYGASLDGYARESLAQDTELVESLRNKNADLQNDLKPVACQVDAKYGRGAELRDRTELVFSVLGAVTVFGAAELGAAGLASSLTGAAAVGSISLRTAGLLRVLAAAGSTAAGLNQAHKACFGQDVSMTSKSAKGAAPSCEANILSSQAKENCLLTSALAALDALGVYATVKAEREAFSKLNKGLSAETGAAAAPEMPSVPTLAKFDQQNFATNPQVEVWRLADGGATAEAAQLTNGLEKSLISERIVSVKDMEGTAANPKLVTLENGLKGIWKNMESRHQSGNAEIAAYVVDRKLGLNHVPITVEKELNGVKGTLQLFVAKSDRVVLNEHPDYFTWFDDLIGNRDRHKGNYLTVSGRPAAIDHGLSFDHPDAWKEEPNFVGVIQKIAAPVEQQARKIQSIEIHIQNSATKFGKGSKEYKATVAEWGPKLLAEKRAHEEDMIIVQNHMSVVLPERSVYQQLKNTTEPEWTASLKDHLSADQIKNFLLRRKKILAGFDKVEKRFGPDIVRSGPVSPFVRRRLVLVNRGRNDAPDSNLDHPADLDLTKGRSQHPEVKASQIRKPVEESSEAISSGALEPAH